MAAILEAKGITKQFGGLTAVNNVDFEIEERSISSLIGPNGAGKTTFFNMITGLYVPTAGAFTFAGQTLNGLKPNQVTGVGIGRTFQNIRLFAHMTALENVLVGQHVRLKTGLVGTLFRTARVRQEEEMARKKAYELLDYAGLGRRRADELSKNLPYGVSSNEEVIEAYLGKGAAAQGKGGRRPAAA
jgi:branched-chain amino acid transport system ATP-binding protein